MNFALTEEQTLLRETVERFVAKDYTFETRQKIRDAGGFNAANWKVFAEMGWLSAGVAEEFGGFGGEVETAIILEQTGRALVLEPMLGCCVLGPQLLIAAASAEQCDATLPAVLAGEIRLAAAYAEKGGRGDVRWVATQAIAAGADFIINGHKIFVLGGSVAQQFIVSARTAGKVGDSAGISLFMVERTMPGVSVKEVELLDGSRAAELHFSNVTVPRTAMLGSEGTGFNALARMSEQGIVAVCAESVGMMEQAIAITREFLKTRKQFGVTLDTFQALQHKIADMVIDAQMARAALYVALAAFFVDDADLRAQRFNAAKASVAAANRRVCGAAVQLHGGMGLTEEYPIGHYLKRMNVLEPVLGNTAFHLNRYTDRLQAACND